MGILKPKLRLASLLVPILLILFSVASVGAQNSGGSGLSISPTLSRYTLKPGEADAISINLKNITGGDIVAQPVVYDFVSDNVSGTPRIITDPKRSSPHSIKKFVVGLQEVPLAKGEQKKVMVPIQILQNTPPGAYYGVLAYKAVPASGAASAKPGEVALSASVSTIVLVTVPGNLKEQVQLLGVRVYAKNAVGTFFTQKPDQVGVEVRNLGNGFSQPFGTVEVRDTFGKQVYSYQLNNISPRSSVLPDTSRTFKDQLKNVNRPGRYTITANIAYSDGSNILIGKKTFWYIPVWLLIAVLLLISALAFLAYRFYHHRSSSLKKSSKRKR